MKYFKPHHLLTKLLFSYTLLILIPFSLSSFILGKTSTQNIKENTLTYITLFVDQISSNIDSYISELDRMTKVSILDDSLCEYLTSDDSTAAYSYAADQYLSQYMLKLMTQQPNIQTITLVGQNGKTFTGTSNFIQNKKAFQEITRLDHLSTDEKGLYISSAHIPSYLIINSKEPVFCVVRNLYSLTNAYTGSIVLNIDCSNILDVININPLLLESGARIIVTNQSGQVITDTSPSFDQDISDSSAPLTFSPEAAQDEDPDTLCFSDTSSFSGLTTTVIVNRKQLFYSSEKFYVFSTTIIILLGIALLIFSIMFSIQLVKPIKDLQEAMKQCSDGNYDICLSTNSCDEIGLLCKNFNTMAFKIKTLLESVYVYQLKNKQAQLEALQNQINPHFLHNTLEAIRMQAIINKDREVANMIKILARLFRITLDRTHNVVSINDELEHVKTYVEIQNMRFHQRFHLDIQVPEQLLNCSIIKLTLQPIVENCITHGFSQTFENETISIHITEAGNDLLINVSDNGKGIDPDNMQRLLSKLRHTDTEPAAPMRHNSIGIVNISERIRLEYGENYYLDIKPLEPHGTAVIIKIPKNEIIRLNTTI